jgi:hypothetical protein
MGTEDNGVILPQVDNKIPDFQDLFGIEARGGFVQDQHFRVADHGLGQPYPLFVALGQVFDKPAGNVVNADSLHNPVHPVLFLFWGDLFDLSGKGKVLGNGHVHIKRRIFGQIADLLLYFRGIFKNVHTVHQNGSFGGRKIPGKDVHGR